MSVRTITIVLIVLVLAQIGCSLLAAPNLPEEVPSHWNAAGEVDGYSSPTMAMFLMPAITLAIGLLLIFLPMIDPLRANVEQFRSLYHWFVAGFLVYFTYIHILTLLAGVGVAFNMTYALIPAFSLLFIGIGFLMDHTQPNWFIGIRTPWTLSSPTVWEKTHKVGAWLFKGAGLLSLAGLFLPTEAAFILMIFPILIASLGSVAYSYFAYRQEMQGS
jgi:uncharacterized membrane protein